MAMRACIPPGSAVGRRQVGIAAIPWKFGEFRLSPGAGC
jgi:hypothetical protein